MCSQFWLENPSVLAQSIEIFPDSRESLEEQLNATTRCILLLWVLLWSLKYKYHIYFLLFALLLIIILYYIQINSMKEPFETIPLQQWRSIPSLDQLKIENPTQYRFCQDDRGIPTNQSYYSTNQALAAPPGKRAGNPKIYRKPLIVPRSHATDYWMDDFVVPSFINDETQQELFLSGAIGSSPCMETRGLQINETLPGLQQLPDKRDGVIEPFAYTGNTGDRQLRPHYGDVGGCAYNPSNLKHNIPSNVPVGECSLNPCFDEYNKQLYTNYLGPETFVRNQVVDSLQSNIGIDYAQQFHPVTCKKEGNNRVFTTEDPRLTSPVDAYQRPPEPTLSNVFDPRSNGYGTSYRTYWDPMSGQQRFYYDDIDAIRRPNYIIRSNVDHAPWASSYGAMTQDTTMSDNLNHALGNRQFTEGTQTLREDLQERYMRSYNNKRGYQLRQAPIHRMSGYMKRAG